MAFVFYDCETSGLNTRFDQILQFAAVRTDESLNEIEVFERRCRLDRHILPHPQALAITGQSVADVYENSLPSHYEMMCEIAALIERWSPAVFVGYNSISFDEEILRHSFYRTLHDPYLTIKQGNARGDALSLARSAAFFRPGLLNIPLSAEGKETFTLGPLAAANGHGPFEAHSALDDARATIALSRIVKDKDDALWSRFLRFTNGKAAAAVLDDGFPIGVVVFRGNVARCTVAVSIGYGKDRNIRYCLDLRRIEELRDLTDDELHERVSGRDGPIIRVKVKGSPSLCELWDLPPEILQGTGEQEYETLAEQVHEDPHLGDRILSALVADEPEWPARVHLEEQLYGGKWLSSEDERLRQLFHSRRWDERLPLLTRISDERTRRLGERLVFLEAPETLSPARLRTFETAVSDRLRRSEKDVPWCTFEGAERVLRSSLPELGSLAEEFAELKARTVGRVVY